MRLGTLEAGAEGVRSGQYLVSAVTGKQGVAKHSEERAYHVALGAGS